MSRHHALIVRRLRLSARGTRFLRNWCSEQENVGHVERFELLGVILTGLYESAAGGFMRSFLPRGILLVALCCLIYFPTFSQNSSSQTSTNTQNSASESENEASSPFSVAITAATPADYDECSAGPLGGKTQVVGLDMRNNGDRPLRGYVLAVWYHDAGSRFVAHSVVSKLIRPSEPMIMPGVPWHSAACGLSPRADLTDPKAQVDLLMYEDGETWGPVELPESNRLDGESIGMNFAAGGDNVQRGYVTATATNADPIGEPMPVTADTFPLKFFATSDRDDHGNLLLDVEATNEGKVPVAGYEYAITFYDSVTHETIKNVTTKALETHGYPADYLQQGETWTSGGRKSPASGNGEPATYSVTLDAAVLANGIVIGPQRSREALELVGMIQGIGAVKIIQPGYPLGPLSGGVVGGVLQ
jgi:hypothetical protein